MGQRIFLSFRSALYISGFMALWLWIVPRWLGLPTSASYPVSQPLRWLGVPPLLLGAAIAANCFVNFVASGSGTPAPFDAPRRLVVSGVYRYVRNPMYVGAGLFLAGCAILFADFSRTLLWYALGLIAGVNLFILVYEEPTLRHKFDGSYEEYCRNVSRWLPRVRPWKPEKTISAKQA